MRVLGGRYELGVAVGRGGMGEVWKSVDRELGRTVAVKVLPAELTRQQEFRDRFRREARTVAALSHHGVATLYDVGEDTAGDEPTPYLVMEFVDGRTLAEALREGPLPIARTVAIARDVADALVHSHGHSVVHRDLKPANIMLTSTGNVKVLDFGIAKVLAETTTRLTVTGMTVGTPAYLSPEQIEGRAVDARTDLYSLGCLIYELLTGRPPFMADSPFAVMHQHLARDAGAPSAMRPQIPEELDALVLRLLAKSPDDRFPTASRLRTALDDLQAHLAGTAPAAVAGTLPNPNAASRQPSWDQAPTSVTAPEEHPPPPAPRTPPSVGRPPVPQPEPSPIRSAGGPWAIRFKVGRDGLLAVAGGALLAGAQLSVAPDGFKGFNYLCVAAAVSGLVALLWSARLATVLVWGPLAGLVSAQFSPSDHDMHRHQAFSAFGDAGGWYASDLKSQEFMAVVPFALLAIGFLVGFLRSRKAPAGYVAAFWLFATTVAWSCRSLTDGQIIVALWIATIALASVTLTQELLVRNGSPYVARAAYPAPQPVHPV
jgi:serine/threonine-protein kinase